MPAIQTSYRVSLEPGFEGQSATQLNDDNSETRICGTSAGIAFGRAVSEGTRAREAVLGGNAFVGISVLDKTLVNSYGDLSRVGDNVGVMLKGDVWVRAVSAVTHGSTATYDAITGQFNPTSGGPEIYGSRYLTSAGAGQMALLRLFIPSTGNEEAGGGAPAWVPANAKIHIDPVGNRAWTEAGGEVAIDTLLGADPNSEGGWGTTDYVSSDLGADGLIYFESPPALIGSARTMVMDGATVVVRTKRVTDVSSEQYSLIAISANGNDAVQIELHGAGPSGDSGARAFSWNGSFVSVIPSIVNSGNGALNCCAVTLTTSRLDIAVNGSAAVAGALTDAQRPAANPLVAGIIDPGSGQYVALQSITIYDPLPDTTGLSELSVVA